MNNGTNGLKARGRVSLLVPILTLLAGCGGGPVSVKPVDYSYLDEVYHFAVENDVPYGSALNNAGATEILRMDVFQPTDDSEPLRPAVLWLHGGSFHEGSKGEMTEYARRFSQRGYVSTAVAYRLRSGPFDYTNPSDAVAEEAARDAQHDVQAAVRWLRSQATALRIDPDRIFVVGYSAGGLAGLRVASHWNDPGTSGNSGFSSMVGAAAAISGSLRPGLLDDAPGPTLLIHGEMDTKVSLASVQSACEPVPSCHVVAVPLGQHNLLPVAKEQVISEVAVFLNTAATP